MARGQVARLPRDGHGRGYGASGRRRARRNAHPRRRLGNGNRHGLSDNLNLDRSRCRRDRRPRRVRLEDGEAAWWTGVEDLRRHRHPSLSRNPTDRMHPSLVIEFLARQRRVDGVEVLRVGRRRGDGRASVRRRALDAG